VSFGTAHALRSFARTWTTELSGRGIRVNLPSPGPTDTATFDDIPAEIRAGIEAMVPAGRFGTAEEIATAVLFLASADCSFIRGTELSSTAASPRSDSPAASTPLPGDAGHGRAGRCAMAAHSAA
jgi:NAD(P)-dependent dehydrogenase (short-subunit alcohol dehydrogenase family)